MNKSHKQKRRPGYSFVAPVCCLGPCLGFIFSISAQAPCPTIPTDSKDSRRGRPLGPLSPECSCTLTQLSRHHQVF